HTTPMFQLIKDMVASYFGIHYPFQDLKIGDDWRKFDLYAQVVNGLYTKTEGYMKAGRGGEKYLFKETSGKSGRLFHVPGSAATPQHVGKLGLEADVNTIRDLTEPNLRSNKLDKRSKSSVRGKARVFVNSAHKRLCQTLLPNYSSVLQQLDKGIW